MQVSYSHLLKTWFSAPVNRHWFSSTTEIDAQLKQQFEALWQQGSNALLDDWKQNAEGCLALVILLDQIPLNIFRNQAKSFSTEQQAVAITRHAIQQQFDQQIDNDRLAFLYMPLMHSENLDDQNLAVNCFDKASLEHNLRFAHHHRDLVKRFGRFPHRNAILGRESTADEIKYLNSDKAFKG